MNKPPPAPKNVREVPASMRDPRAEHPTTRPPPGGASVPPPPVPIPPSLPMPPIIAPAPASFTFASAAPSSRSRQSAAPRPSGSLPPAEGALVSAARFHRQIAQLQQQLADIQRELSLTNEERAAEAERFEDTLRELLVTQADLHESDSRVAVGQELLAAARDRERELDTELDALRTTLEARLTDERTRLEAEKTSAHEARRVAEQQRGAIEGQLIDRDLEIARLRGEVVTVRELKETRSRELSAVRVDAESTASKMRTLEMKNTTLENELAQLRTEMARSMSEQLGLCEDLKVARSEAQSLRSTFETIQGLLVGLERIGGAVKNLRVDAEKALGVATKSDAPPAKKEA
ncbi:MAG TPA: hypothetical protein VIF62_16175 [Labilithrix sp.]